MTRDQIIQCARDEARSVASHWQMGGLSDGVYMDFAEEVACRVAALVAAHEREECAKVCDAKALAEYPQTARGLGFSFSLQWDSARNAEKACAAAIRARTKQ